MRRTKALDRTLFDVAPLALALALASVWLFVFVFRIAQTPPKLSNEAELMYEASRIERGLPLYTDPLQGVLDDGPLPIRHYVLYGPVAPWLLSFVAQPFRLIVARSISVIVWFVGIPAIALGGMRDRRVAALVVALSYASLFLLARDVVHFTLTPIPVFLAAVALVRFIRLGRLDIVSSFLFTAAWMIKPLVIGVALAVALWTVFDRQRRRSEQMISIFGGALSVCVGIGLLVATSHGQWLAHLRASTATGILPMHWVHFVHDYFPILGFPHLVVAIFLLASAEGARDVRSLPDEGTCSVSSPRRAKMAGWVLLVSTLWSVFAMGKRGSNAGYFMEPCAALIAALAYGLPAPEVSPRDWRATKWARVARLVLPLCPVMSVAIGWPEIRSFWREDASEEWRLLRDVNNACGAAAPGAAVRASLPSLELPLSGRVTLAAWQQTVLVNRGVFPLQLLITDLDIPELGCLVLTRGLSGPAPLETDGVGEFVFFDVLFDVKLRQPILDRFDEFATVGGLHLFRRKRGGNVR